jgi:hypothetical protein
MISQEAFYDRVNALHERRPDGRFYQLGYDGKWLLFDYAAGVWHDVTAQIKRARIRKALFSALSVLLAVLLVLSVPPSRAWVKSELFGIQPRPVSGLPDPVNGTSLSCSGNSRRASPFMRPKAPCLASEGCRVYNRHRGGLCAANQAGLAVAVLHAFEFDAGLDEDETFEKTVSIDVDMKAAGFYGENPKDLVVYRLGKNGPEPLNFSVTGDVLTIYTHKNSAILTGILLSVLSAVSGVLVKQEQGEKYGDATYRAYKIPVQKYAGYTIYWPVHHKTSKPRDGSKTAQIERDIREVVNTSGLIWSESDGGFTAPYSTNRQFYTSVRQAQSSEAYQRIEKQFSDINFLLKYVYPEKVAILAEYIMHAHDYLFDGRGFMTVDSGVDFVMRDPWPASVDDASGLCLDIKTKYPFVLINMAFLNTAQDTEDELQVFVNRGHPADKINNLRQLYNAEREGRLDALHGTVLHELFHAVQEEYKNHILSDNKHFCEATALLVESEGVAEYLKKGYLFGKDYILTDNNRYELFETAWGEDADNVGAEGDKIAQRHGYSFYNVLKYNRDNTPAWKKDPDSYLMALMNYYKSNKAASCLSFVSDPRLMQEYALANAAVLTRRIDGEKFKKNKNIFSLSAANPFLSLKDAAYSPYSLKLVKLKTDSKTSGAAVVCMPAGPKAPQPDWLGLSFCNEAVSDSMRYQEIPAKDLFVLPAADACLMITQDFTQNGATQRDWL